MDTFVTPIILGIVEGLTEFLPVSSTGHLIIATDLLHQNQQALASFNIIIQFGAILAVVVLYWSRFKNLFNHHNLNWVHIGIAIVPVLGIGFVTRKLIKHYLFNPGVVTFTTIFVAFIIILVEKKKPTPVISSLDELSYKDAFIIGLGQCFALIPGVSRSGATMLTAMMRKVDIKTSADFSFLISVPVITAATLYELLKSYKDFHTDEISQLLIGLVVSFVVAIIAIKSFLIILKKVGLTPFAYYRIIFGIIYFLYSR
jgi:undecaprenyl-diphosphatase